MQTENRGFVLLFRPEPEMTADPVCWWNSDKASQGPERDWWLSCCLFELTVCPERKHSAGGIIIPPRPQPPCCCLQGGWQTHGQIRNPLHVSPQPSISRRARRPGVCGRVFYDRAGLECPGVTQALRRPYDRLTSTRGKEFTQRLSARLIADRRWAATWQQIRNGFMWSCAAQTDGGVNVYAVWSCSVLFHGWHTDCDDDTDCG